jgi:hypothetical protein
MASCNRPPHFTYVPLLPPFLFNLFVTLYYALPATELVLTLVVPTSSQARLPFSCFLVVGLLVARKSRDSRKKIWYMLPSFGESNAKALLHI